MPPLAQVENASLPEKLVGPPASSATLPAEVRTSSGIGAISLSCVGAASIYLNNAFLGKVWGHGNVLTLDVPVKVGDNVIVKAMNYWGAHEGGGCSISVGFEDYNGMLNTWTSSAHPVWRTTCLSSEQASDVSNSAGSNVDYCSWSDAIFAPSWLPAPLTNVTPIWFKSLANNCAEVAIRVKPAYGLTDCAKTSLAEMGGSITFSCTNEGE